MIFFPLFDSMWLISSRRKMAWAIRKMEGGGGIRQSWSIGINRNFLLSREINSRTRFEDTILLETKLNTTTIISIELNSNSILFRIYDSNETTLLTFYTQFSHTPKIIQNFSNYLNFIRDYSIRLLGSLEILHPNNIPILKKFIPENWKFSKRYFSKRKKQNYHYEILVGQ